MKSKDFSTFMELRVNILQRIKIMIHTVSDNLKCENKESNKFLEIVKYILDKHNDTIFLSLGNGNSQMFEDFIISDNFQNRVVMYVSC